MKKVLSATTALVSATMLVAPAQAADPIQIQVGGFMEQWVGYADNDSLNNTVDRAEFDTKSDTEIFFRGSTTLDNGLRVAVRVDMEGDHPAGANDDSFLTVSSDTYGTLIIGQTKHAAYDIQHDAPDVGIGLTDGDTGNWITAPGGFAGRTNSFGLPNVIGANDSNKVKYMTPSFYGLTLGASYSPEEADGNGQPNRRVTATGPAWSAGGIFETEFEGVGIAVNAGVARVGNERINATTANAVTSATLYEAGGSLSYAGFTLQGGWLRTKSSDTQRAQTVSAVSIDGYGYSVGLSYATGPYAVSLSYGHNEEEGLVNDNDQDEEDAWMLSGRYDLGAGVSLRGSIFSQEYTGEVQNDGGADDNDGWGVVTGLRVDF